MRIKDGHELRLPADLVFVWSEGDPLSGTKSGYRCVALEFDASGPWVSIPASELNVASDLSRMEDEYTQWTVERYAGQPPDDGGEDKL